VVYLLLELRIDAAGKPPKELSLLLEFYRKFIAENTSQPINILISIQIEVRSHECKFLFIRRQRNDIVFGCIGIISRN